jgi:hypothetical protein
MIEKWMTISGFKGYYKVSTLGNVKSLKRTVVGPRGTRMVRERLLTKTENLYGYMSVTLHKQGKNKTITVNRLMELAFKNGNVCKHENFDRTDNRIENLVEIN